MMDAEDRLKNADSVIEVSSQNATLMEEIYDLRCRSWGFGCVRNYFQSGGGMLLDDYDKCSNHYGIIRDGQVVAASRVTVCEGWDDIPDGIIFRSAFCDAPKLPVGVLGRLVVSIDYRGHGYVYELTEAAIRAAVRSKARTIILCTSRSSMMQLPAFREFKQVGEKVIPPPGYFNGGRPLHVLVYNVDEGG